MRFYFFQVIALKSADFSRFAIFLFLCCIASVLFAQKPCVVKEKYRYEEKKNPKLIEISTYCAETRSWKIEHRDWRDNIVSMRFDTLGRLISQHGISRHGEDSTVIVYDEKPFHKVIYEYSMGKYNGKQTFENDSVHSLEVERHVTEKGWTLSEKRHYYKKYASKSFPVADVYYWISEEGVYDFIDSLVFLYKDDTLLIGERRYDKDKQVNWSLSSDVEYEDGGKKEIYYWFERGERKIH